MNGRSDGNGTHAPRDVRYLEIFEALAADFEPDRSILDEKLRGLEFNIARVPELYELSRRSGKLPLRAAIYGGRPRLRIWFTYDHEPVTLMGIQRI